jgi:hypothetical protein
MLLLIPNGTTSSILKVERPFIAIFNWKEISADKFIGANLPIKTKTDLKKSKTTHAIYVPLLELLLYYFDYHFNLVNMESYY